MAGMQREQVATLLTFRNLQRLRNEERVLLYAGTKLPRKKAGKGDASSTETPRFVRLILSALPSYLYSQFPVA